MLAQTSPSQHLENKPALSHSDSVGFRFLDTFGDINGDGMKLYKNVEIKRGKKWYVQYLFWKETERKYIRKKVYENINRVKGKEQEEYAQTLLNAVKGALKKGYNPFAGKKLAVAVKNWTLNQGLNLFKQNLDQRGLRKRSVQSYQSVLRMLNKELVPLGNEPIKDITRQQISKVLLSAKSKNKWNNTTFNNNLTFTKAIFNYLIDQEILEISPAERIKPLPQTITKHRYFDDKTFEKIKEKADKELLDFIMFLYHTGTRPNEARQLYDHHILRERKLLLIPASVSKNKKDDYVPLSDYVLQNYQQKGRLFKAPVNYYGEKFRKLKESLELLKDYTLYSIKATRAIHLAQDGADPYTIMQLFRHSGLDITMSYLRDLGININREATTKGIRF